MQRRVAAKRKHSRGHNGTHCRPKERTGAVSIARFAAPAKRLVQRAAAGLRPQRAISRVRGGDAWDKQACLLLGTARGRGGVLATPPASGQLADGGAMVRARTTASSAGSGKSNIIFLFR